MKPLAPPTLPAPSATQFIMIGGFLGAGKTTGILKFAEWLAKTKKLKAGLITNDQANGLVDTALANGGKFQVKEIGGGCFCCRSGMLVEAMQEFSRTAKPDVLVGEPVGSCTDLVSTVLEPLRHIYHADYRLAPLSVVVDPFRAERLFSRGAKDSAGNFSNEVDYIYRKQLEEAALIVVNKCDIFAQTRLTALCATLREHFPSAEVLKVSARTGIGLNEWWERLLRDQHTSKPPMDVNYGVYADGEARLGWLNGEYDIQLAASLRTSSETIQINGNKLLEMLVGSIKESFHSSGIEVAHLKVALEPKEVKGARKMGAIQWVRSDSEPEFTKHLKEPFTQGRMLLNLRAEAEPDLLSDLVARGFRRLRTQVSVRRRNYSAFKPAPPKPTFRVTNPA